MNELEDFLRNAAKLRPATEERQAPLPRRETPQAAPGPSPAAPGSPSTASPVDRQPPEGSAAAARPATNTISLLELLGPEGLAQSFLVSEILRRPVERWGRNW